MRWAVACLVGFGCCALSAIAQAQSSPPAWSPQSSTSGCGDGKGCHNALIASAALGAIPTATLGVELAAGANVRLGPALRLVLMGLGAASLVVGAWDGYAYRSDGAGDYLPGPIVGGILGGGTLVANFVLLVRPEASAAAAGSFRWRPTVMYFGDRDGRPGVGGGVVGALF